MAALKVIVNDETRKRLAEDYAMQHLWLLTGAVYAMGGADLKTPSYVELAHPEIKVRDTRTAEQIKQDILRKVESIPEGKEGTPWTL